MLELANMIGNITNALNFEVKSAALKNNQIAELEMQVESARIRSQTAIEQNEMSYQSMRQEIEQACERKIQRFRELSVELEKVNKDLLDKAESLSKVNKQNEAKIAESETRLKQLSATVTE